MIRLVDRHSEIKMLGAALSIISVMALWITTLNVNACCFFIAHENELPEEATSLRKF